MLPKSVVEENVLKNKKTSYTNRIDFENKTLGEMIDGKEAIAQAVRIALMTQRYKYPVFPHSYGTDYSKVFNEGYMKAMGIVKNAICDSLLCDDRILKVDGFVFERQGKKMLVTFCVKTSEGNIEETEEIDL